MRDTVKTEVVPVLFQIRKFILSFQVGLTPMALDHSCKNLQRVYDRETENPVQVPEERRMVVGELRRRGPRGLVMSRDCPLSERSTGGETRTGNPIPTRWEFPQQNPF